jgi:hypothetical protein
MNFEKNDEGCIRFTNTSGINFDMWSLILKRLNWLGYGMPDEDSVKEYFDKGTFLQQDQSIEVLKLFGEMHDSEKYSDAQIKRDNNIARKHFGLTDNIDCAGYLLINGDMLNFSYDGYKRTEDHRAIAYPLGISTEDCASAGLIQFVGYGNIRLLGRGFELCKPPTQAQRKRLAELIRKTEDLYVDISNYEGHVVKEFSYPIPTPGTVFRDIDEYFADIQI